MRFSKEKEAEKIFIWGEKIPGNTGQSKKDIMNWDDSLSDEDLFLKYPGIWDKSSDEIGEMKGNDTMVYRDEIKNGYAEETYSDVPFLMPFLVPGSDKCVIACPGGAYLTKSIENEGMDIAEFLNKAGISCFVLWYRSYPYKAPYMFLDLQRAIRYLRVHAKEYGFQPDRIATVGFSAGGNLAAVQALITRNTPITDYVADGYVPDEVDKADGRPNAVGLIYPAVSVANDKIQVVMNGKDAYNDPAQREAFGKKYETKDFVQEGDAPMFLLNAQDDEVIDAYLMVDLARELRKKKVQAELHVFPYGGHGFGGCKPQPAFPGVPAPDLTAVSQWKDLFVTWLEKVFDKK